MTVSRYAPAAPVAPAPGVGATIVMYSDRHAATIVEVSASGKTVTVQQDTATRTDTNGMSDCQTYTFAPNPAAPLQVFTLRSTGRYVPKGVPTKSAGMSLAIGTRQEHYDFSF